MKTSFANEVPTDSGSLSKIQSHFEPRIQELIRPMRSGLKNDVEMAELVEIVKNQKAIRQEIIDHHAPMKQQANRLHKTICDQENALVKPLSTSIGVNERLIGIYISEQRQKLLAEQQEAQKAVEKQFEKRIEKQAVQLEKQGKVDEAESLREAGQRNMPVISLPGPAIPEGVREAKVEYTFEVENATAIPKEWLLPLDKDLFDVNSYPRIKAYVKAVGQGVSIPGIKVRTKDPKAQVRL